MASGAGTAAAFQNDDGVLSPHQGVVVLFCTLLFYPPTAASKLPSLTAGDARVSDAPVIAAAM